MLNVSLMASPTGAHLSILSKKSAGDYCHKCRPSLECYLNVSLWYRRWCHIVQPKREYKRGVNKESINHGRCDINSGIDLLHCLFPLSNIVRCCALYPLVDTLLWLTHCSTSFKANISCCLNYWYNCPLCQLPESFHFILPVIFKCPEYSVRFIAALLRLIYFSTQPLIFCYAHLCV